MTRNGSYAVYHGKEYQLIIRPLGMDGAEQYELLSFEESDAAIGFLAEANAKYRRIAAVDELDFAYDVTLWCKYKGHEFQLLNYSEDDDEFDVLGLPSQPVKELGFEFWERGAYRKTLNKQELDSLYEVRSPLFDFEIPEEYRNNPGNHPNEYIVPIIENAKK